MSILAVGCDQMEEMATEAAMIFSIRPAGGSEATMRSMQTTQSEKKYSFIMYLCVVKGLRGYLKPCDASLIHCLCSYDNQKATLSCIAAHQSEMHPK